MSIHHWKSWHSVALPPIRGGEGEMFCLLPDLLHLFCLQFNSLCLNVSLLAIASPHAPSWSNFSPLSGVRGSCSLGQGFRTSSSSLSLYLSPGAPPRKKWELSLGSSWPLLQLRVFSCMWFPEQPLKNNWPLPQSTFFFFFLDYFSLYLVFRVRPYPYFNKSSWSSPPQGCLSKGQ